MVPRGCDNGFRADAQEEVTHLRSLSDFLVPSPVACEAASVSPVHLSHPLKRDLNSPDVSAELRLPSLGERRISRCVQTRWPSVTSTVPFLKSKKQNKKQNSTSSSPEPTAPALRWCWRPPPDLSMTANAVMTPSMTSSNSMSSGYCSLDDESDDFTFFTAKTSFFHKPRHTVKQNEAKEEEERGTKDLSEEEVQTRIEEYNAQVSENGMKLASDGSFTGFIKVHLRLSRPVTVPTIEGSEGTSRQTGSHNVMPSECLEVTDGGHSDKRTSFYLPSDCVKQLHISSLITTREVIQGLLKKFMVLDNPRKFALYRQTHRDGQDLFQKLPLHERPLLLRLIAGPDTQQLSFVLKENETGEVEWHAFSVPELQNFLVILEKEEAERVRAVEQKYATFRQKLQQTLRQHDP